MSRFVYALIHTFSTSCELLTLVRLRSEVSSVGVADCYWSGYYRRYLCVLSDLSKATIWIIQQLISAVSLAANIVGYVQTTIICCLYCCWSAVYKTSVTIIYFLENLTRLVQCMHQGIRAPVSR